MLSTELNFFFFPGTFYCLEVTHKALANWLQRFMLVLTCCPKNFMVMLTTKNFKYTCHKQKTFICLYNVPTMVVVNNLKAHLNGFDIHRQMSHKSRTKVVQCVQTLSTQSHFFRTKEKFICAFDKVTDLFKWTQYSCDRFVERKVGQKVETV